MTETGRNRGLPDSWDEEYDVVVVGFGYAGGIAAIEAHDAGARVLLIEKMPDPGGISVCSGGNLRVARDAEKAFAYLRATNAETAPDELLRILAEGMTGLNAYLARLAKVNDAKVETRERSGNYPFPGFDTFGYTHVAQIPGFDAAAAYPHVQGLRGGQGARLFKVVQDNVERREIAVRLETGAERLIADGRGEVRGLAARKGGATRALKARRGVVLACGGFEADEEMKKQFWQGKPVLFVATRGNTGDGIRMACQVGGALWHMWHYHGTYGFMLQDAGQRWGIRTKRLPDWTPGRPAREDVRMPWILIDKTGRRFMNEYAPYLQDTGHRPMELFDPITQSYPRIPSYMIFDEAGRRLYPLGSAIFNDRESSYEWSEDNLKEVELGILRRAESLPEMAEGLGISEAVLGATLERWNSLCRRGEDADFLRPPPSMMAIATPPFYHAEVWPIVSNTQGGPVHNAKQQVLDTFGQPIPRLYTAGELGSAFGHLYLGGGNLSECFIGGRIAGIEAASLAPWE